MSNRFFLQHYFQLDYRNGGIGYVDIEKILLAEGYQPVSLKKKGNIFLLGTRLWQMVGFFKTISRHDIVIVQHPVYPKLERLLIRMLARKKVTLIFILSDIDGLKDDDPQLLEKELRWFKLAAAFVVHSPNMERWLKNKLPGVICSQLGPFDFLATPSTIFRSKSSAICFAGNLHKSGFLRSLHNIRQLQFLLYGPGLQPENLQQSNVTWKGSFPPAALPAIIEGAFGLVWDGDSFYTAEGPLGQYMQYIFHHKISLYILAGLPIIAPAFAGSASYIRENGLGWLVNDLDELPDLVAKITEEEYQAVRYNLKNAAEKLATGQQLKHALEKLGISS